MGSAEVSIDALVGRYEIEVPGNGISSIGIEQIQENLQDWGLDAIPDVILLPKGNTTPWYWDWKVGGKGEYVGTLPKRISKLVWQARGVKLTQEQLSKIGNIGSAHSGKHATYHFDVVNHAEWGRSDFGQPDDCCFWGCHASAKDMILDNGGGAIRFFSSKSYNRLDGIARAWLVPWHDCWIVFNGYGLETLAIARILAAHFGHTYYRKVALRNNGESAGDLWINGGTAYLVGPQESVLEWEKIDLKWEEIEKYTCVRCGESIDENDHSHSPDGEDFCNDCFEERCFYCRHCEEIFWSSGVHWGPNEETLCEDCYNAECTSCAACNKILWFHDAIEDSEGERFCQKCYSDRYSECDNCEKEYLHDDLTQIDGGIYCEDCLSEHSEEEEEPVCTT